MDIQVVLTENDPKLGKRGQVIKVSSGYAQNFLFPHKKAQPATPANLRSFEQEKARASKEEAEHLAQAKEQAARITSVQLKLEVSVGEGEKLFGSVTSQDILEALSKQGIILDRKNRSNALAAIISRSSSTLKSRWISNWTLSEKNENACGIRDTARKNATAERRG